MTEIDVGFACIIGTTLLWDIYGRSKTTELILSGGFLSSADAKEWGMVTKVVPLGELDNEAMCLASMLAEKPPVAVKNNKKWFRQLTEESFEKCIDFACQAHKEGYAAGEPNEWHRRFFEIRKARKS